MMSEEKIIERTPQEVHDNIVKLLQENQQLKKQNARLTREVCNGLIANYDYSSTLKDELNKERINNIVLKEANKITNEENNQLKDVIEEVSESKDEYVCTEEYCGEVGIETTKFIEKLGQILDKVKEL